MKNPVLLIAISGLLLIVSCIRKNSTEEQPNIQNQQLQMAPAPVAPKALPKKANFAKRNVISDAKVNEYLKLEKNTQQHLSKVKREVRYFLDYLHRIVKLSPEQRVELDILASKVINVKLNIVDQINTIKANPESDQSELRNLHKALNLKHLEEQDFLKNTLKPEQYQIYVKKKQDEKITGQLNEFSSILTLSAKQREATLVILSKYLINNESITERMKTTDKKARLILVRERATQMKRFNQAIAKIITPQQYETFKSSKLGKRFRANK